MKEFGKFVYGLLVAVFAAFVVTKLWGWFIVPFFETKPLTIAYALGFSLIVSLYKGIKIDDKEKDLEHYVIITIIPPLALLFGWILQFFV